MLDLIEFRETDPNKKTEAWGDKMVTHFRTYWRPLVDSKTCQENMNIILSRYDMNNVMKMFKDPKKLGMEFLSIAIMEKVRNILLGESTKSGLGANINALDPVAADQKKKDKKLLDNRKEIEEIISFLQQSIGLPEYKLQHEKEISGEEQFNGNVEMFDELGLDSEDSLDKGYFMKAWHRLQHEMDAQEIVNAYIKLNELEEHIEDWLNDIMAKKAIANTRFVNEMTGAIDIKYQEPENVMLIPGKRKDGNDSVCIGTVDVCSIGQVIQRLGNNFSLQEEWLYLINAINFNNKSANYSGLFDDNGILYDSGKNKKYIHINDFLNFKVQIGYIEFKSIDQTVYKYGKDFNGNSRYYQKSVDYVPEDTGYTKQSWYNENTYKAWFVATSSDSQRLYGFGKRYHQIIKGAEDEYSTYSIGFRKMTGPTVAEVSKPWIEIAQESFTKFRWMVRRAKPKGRAYNYESLVQIAKHMINTGSTKEQVHQVIQMFEEGINEIFTIPKVDGQRVGGGIIPNMELPNGLDPTAITFQQIIDWAVNNIKQDLGINDIREAYSPKTNDVYKLQAATLESSRNATAYIPNMFDGLMRDTAKDILLTAQDIVQYPNTLPYDFLQTLVGYGPIKSMKRLEKIALHRYGIFVNSFSTYQERQNVLRDVEIAFQNAEITYEIKLLINSIDDYRKAAYILAYEKQRAQKIKEKEMQVAHERAMEADKNRHAIKMEEINAEGKWQYDKADRTGWWLFQANRDDNETKKSMLVDKSVQRQGEIENKTDADIRKETAKKNLQNQEVLPG